MIGLAVGLAAAALLISLTSLLLHAREPDDVTRLCSCGHEANFHDGLGCGVSTRPGYTCVCRLPRRKVPQA